MFATSQPSSNYASLNCLNDNLHLPVAKEEVQNPNFHSNDMIPKKVILSPFNNFKFNFRIHSFEHIRFFLLTELCDITGVACLLTKHHEFSKLASFSEKQHFCTFWPRWHNLPAPRSNANLKPLDLTQGQSLTECETWHHHQWFR